MNVRVPRAHDRLARSAIAVVLIVGACNKRSEPLSQNLNVANKVEVRAVTLFYEAQEMLLVPEKRDVALPENPAGALPIVVRELFKGSATPGVPRPLPADTIVRGAYLLPDGTAFVDLGGPTLSEGWGAGSHQELIAVYSVVQTVIANFPDAKRVRLLVNGEPAETLAGHISLAKALTPLPYLTARNGNG